MASELPETPRHLWENPKYWAVKEMLDRKTPETADVE